MESSRVFPSSVMRTCLVVTILLVGVSATSTSTSTTTTTTTTTNNNHNNHNNNNNGTTRRSNLTPESDNSTDPQRHCTDEICLTPACIHTASRVLRYMDRSVNPCDGFYSFACGEFVRTTNIPDEKTSVNTFSLVRDLVSEQLRTIIEEPMNETEIRPVKLAKKLYNACLNLTLLEERGLDPIKNIIKGLGGWPLLEGTEWNNTDFNWVQTVYKLKNLGLGINFLLGFSIGSDAKNTTTRTLAFDQASLGLSREYFIKGFGDKRVAAYHTYQTDIAVILGADRDQAARELREALDFEMALANISMSNEERRNRTLLYNPMSIEEMQTKYPSIQWLEYINTIMPESVQVNASEVVMVYNPNYITQLEALLASTDKRIVANYVFWRIAKSLVSSSTQEMTKASLKYSTASSGVLTETPRWKKCTNTVSDAFILAISSMYVKRFFDETSKRAALEMVEDIQVSFKDILTKLDWMDETTKEKALLKAKSITSFIAYPDELLDDNKIEDFYKALEVDEGMFLESMLNVSKFGTEYVLSRLREEVNKTDWKSHSKAVDVNAFYRASENSIQFPAGILQGAFFSSEIPKYMNYGAIGYVIGHEITHGFDDKGRQSDSDGNLAEWWNPETKQKFLKKAACIIEQYGNFTEPTTGLNLNGVKTQGENIADNGGIKETYDGYQRWSERQKLPEQRLPGLEWLTPRQMLWVAGAQMWCDKSRVASMSQLITTGVHSPKQFRVDGPFSNAEEFARDFNCPVGSKMNPVQRCKVW